MGFTIIEKKIFICSLGIVLITLLCYVVFNRLNRIREPLPPFKIPVVDDIVGIANFISKMAMDIAKNIKDQVTNIRNNLMADARKVQTVAKIQATKLEIKADAAIKAAAAKADREAKSIRQQLRDTAYAIKNRAGQITQSVKQRAYQVEEQAKQKTKETKGIRRAFQFFRKYWKYITAFFLFLSGVGQWCIKNVETLIYRIANFKNCFLWYVLEVVGWVLYIPIEFFVWLCCLKDLENMIWDLMKQVDCSFNDITGFHFMYYSTDVIKKCYSRKFVPFPQMKFDFTLKGLEKEGGKFIMDFLLPISPEEAAEAAKAGAREATKFGKELESKLSPIPVM
jgi:hypothetical protein